VTLHRSTHVIGSISILAMIVLVVYLAVVAVRGRW
jgi:hypothetical protein